MTSTMLFLASHDSGVDWGMVVTLVLWVAAMTAPAAAMAWALARRRRGEEASTRKGEGAEAMIHWGNGRL